MRWSYLGRVAYREALELQHRLRAAIRRGRAPDTLLLLEHPPVITLGRSARPENVLLDERELARRGVELVRVERGGDVTYHGPGQLVGYPVRLVGRAVRDHVQGMADAVAAVLARRGIEARWRADRPGVWTDRGKIAAVGVDARGGIAIHGFALNVSPDLGHFSMIVPCGVPGAAVTSIEETCGASPSLAGLARELADLLARRWYGDEALQLPPEALVEAAS
jgi:lipoate-protein ligase B